MRTISIITIIGFVGSPALAVDPCVIGVWEPDYVVFGEQYAAAMNADRVSVGGEMFLSVAESEVGTYLVENLVIDVEIAGTPPMVLTLNGNGEFNIHTEEDDVFHIAMGPFSYSASAAIDMGDGAPMVIDVPVTDEMAPFGGAAGAYTCSDSTLEFEPIRGEDGIVKNMITKWYRT